MPEEETNQPTTVAAQEASEAVKPHVPPVNLISRQAVPPDTFANGLPVTLNVRSTEPRNA